MSRTFRPLEAEILTALGRSGDEVLVDDLARLLGCDQSPVAGAASVLEGEGLVGVREELQDELRLGPKAEQWVDGLAPERAVATALRDLGGNATIKDLGAHPTLDARRVGESLRWLEARGWARKDGGQLALVDFAATPQADERLVQHLQSQGPALEADLMAQGVPVAEGLALLTARAGIVEKRERRRRYLRLEQPGRDAVAMGVTARREVNELTGEMLVTAKWQDVDFRAYDVTLPGPRLVAGKEHPFRRILEATRRVFLEMGFDETASPWVESAFWDFDALFQPQDHPARDMQDTFYMSAPSRCRLPDPALVDRVRRTHEDGGDTGSVGWRTRWDRGLAERAVLRTHTTAATIRELARDPRPPRKVFCVGPVFRRETIDYKHLPVFHQVDGIVIDDRASFAALLGLLETFYRKLGFDRIQFRPGFFPYTEPSVEVFVFMDSRNDWVEMGGAGVFRPEVTEPLGCNVPVLAWGLGLERIAMFRYALSDIRSIYLADLDWLEGTPLCRS